MSRWATFDCYGTLIDWNAGIGGVLEQLWGAEQAPTLLRRYHELEPEIQDDGYRSYSEVLALTLERLASEVGYGIPEGEGGALSQSLPDWPPYPEVPKALEELRGRGWSLAILSNIDRTLIVESEKRLGVPVRPDRHRRRRPLVQAGPRSLGALLRADDSCQGAPRPRRRERVPRRRACEGARAEDGLDQPRRRGLVCAHIRCEARS